VPGRVKQTITINISIQIKGRSKYCSIAERPRNRGSAAGRSKKCFYSPELPHSLWGYSTSDSTGTEVFSPEAKRPRYETDHSRLTSAELNEWSYTPISPYAFMSCTKTTSPFTKYNQKKLTVNTLCDILLKRQCFS